MVKSLLLLSVLIGVNSMPVATNSNDQCYGVQERQYQHTEDVGNTAVTYKYETNEVNSIDDLVVGNVYKFNYTQFSDIPFLKLFFTAIYNFGDIVSVENTGFTFLQISNYSSTWSRIASNNNNSICDVYNGYIQDNNYFYFVYYSSSDVETYIQNIAISDFNVILSVDYDAPITIFGHLAEVLGDNLYGGIPNVDNVIFNIGGQDITLKSWLVTSTCIVLAVVLITILCLFIRWLFKLFSNTILLR